MSCHFPFSVINLLYIYVISTVYAFTSLNNNIKAALVVINIQLFPNLVRGLTLRTVKKKRTFKPDKTAGKFQNNVDLSNLPEGLSSI